MLELQEVSLQLGDSPEDQILLNEVSARFRRKHFAAIIGPSGCGKSTLLKVIAGLRESTHGRISWDGRDLAEEGDMDPHEIGYVPQFSIAFELLTVIENLDSALRLRVDGLDAEEREAHLNKILREVGIEEIADRQVRVLSGGQKRRLALALEMLSSPHLLLCDEVTSGLDPKAEDEITRLMHGIAHSENRIVLSVTHSLRHLALYDSVVVLYQGRLAYHGPSDYLFHYFHVNVPEELFPRLAERKAEEWHQSWMKHRDTYYSRYKLDPDLAADTAALEEVSDMPAPAAESMAQPEHHTPPEQAPHDADAKSTEPPVEETLEKTPEKSVEAVHEKTVEEPPKAADSKHEDAAPKEKEPPAPTGTPSALTQFLVMLARRWKIFFRDRGNIALQFALLVGFPCLVVIFALNGLPQIKVPESTSSKRMFEQMEQLKNDAVQQQDQVHAGSLVSGLIMFQVVLLALMGSNNSAREIAAERLIFEKEKFAGVRPSAYVASKVAFLGVLVLVQSVWMGIFVNFVVQFKGSLAAQILLLLLVNGALTSICLAISSLMKTPEQASLVSIYLVGFQLPLSGAVLALPDAFGWLIRPFIASYWAWSGFIQTMLETPYYDAVLAVTQTKLSPGPLCAWVLGCHIVIGILIAGLGCRNSHWE
jgi:ABC-type multidrug transport system ATPase subunit